MHKTAYALIGVGAALEIATYLDKNGSTNSPMLDSVMNFNQSISSTGTPPTDTFYLHLGVLAIVAGVVILYLHKGAS